VKPAVTIAAVATPPGCGGVGIVRVAGPKARDIALALLGDVPRPRFATLATFRAADGRALDHGLALYFPAPHSFTGDDVLELHGHGGPVVMDLLLARVLELGARLARPGEFSERAFLNGKLDLAQAEAIADLINASSATAARGALNSLSGEFSRRVQALTEALIALRTHIEAAIDFPEEEVDFLADERIVTQLAALQTDLDHLLENTRQGALLRDGLTVVLAGRPNAGKSSLLNALAQQETAIVSPIPGTTRDLLRERIAIDGLPLHVIDTAGLRETGEAATRTSLSCGPRLDPIIDAIETEGMRRAKQAMTHAERVLLIVDDSEPDADMDALRAHLPRELPYTVIRNKIDLTGRKSGFSEAGSVKEIALSAKTGAGMDALRTHLKECLGYQPAGEGTFIARRRHLDALRRSHTHIARAAQHLKSTRAGELAAEELRLAQQALGEITGEFTPDDLLGRIFAEFCIGK
jgi:tRNA modification GTPase